MSKTVRHNKKFTKEENEKIKEYFETPEGERIPMKEFAKSLNHSPRAVRERYIYYIQYGYIKFTEEDIQRLNDYVDKFKNDNANDISWQTISLYIYGHKYLSLKLRDKYNSFSKQRKKSSVSAIKYPVNYEKQQDDNWDSLFNDFEDQFTFDDGNENSSSPDTEFFR